MTDTELQTAVFAALVIVDTLPPAITSAQIAEWMRAPNSHLDGRMPCFALWEPGGADRVFEAARLYATEMDPEANG